MTPAAALPQTRLAEPSLADLLAHGRRLASLGRGRGRQAPLSRRAEARSHFAWRRCSTVASGFARRPPLGGADRLPAGDLLPPPGSGRAGQPRQPAIESGEFEGRGPFEAALAVPPALRRAPGHGPRPDRTGRCADGGGSLAGGLGDGWLAPQPFAARAPVALLLLVSAKGGNIPTRALLDDTVFAVTALYTERTIRPRRCPARGDLQRHRRRRLCGEALETAEVVARRRRRRSTRRPPWSRRRAPRCSAPGRNSRWSSQGSDR